MGHLFHQTISRFSFFGFCFTLLFFFPSITVGQTLKIHQINVQQGDCTLIVGPDGTTLLIDAGNEGKGSSEVVPYLKSIGIMPAQGIDYMIASHRDSDHLGGLDEVIAAGYDVEKDIWDNGSKKTNKPINDFLKKAKTTTAGAAKKIPLDHVIQLGDGATARCVAVGGNVLGHGKVVESPGENDKSVAILVTYKDFEYITAGDLGGGDSDRSCTDRSTSQDNIETPLAITLMPGGEGTLLGKHGVEVLDVNHHGSESSTNIDYMNLLTPKVAVINTGSGQGSNYKHPRVDVVENVLMAQVECVTSQPAFVLQTEEGSPRGSNTSKAGFCVGDIVIETSGKNIFKITATGEVSQGPDERAAAGLINGRIFQMDGADSSTNLTGQLVISEIMQNPDSVSDTQGEWFEIYNPGSTPVDINGWTIKDDDSDSHKITHTGPLNVPPMGYLVLGRNGDSTQNGGYTANYVYTGINLSNTEDEIILQNKSGQIVDKVVYSNKDPWPVPTGRSMVLKDNSSDNSNGSNWKNSTTRGGTFTGSESDKGSPGS